MACAPSEDSDQPGHPPSLAVRMMKAWVLSYPLSAQRRLWSDWTDAQADLSLRWVHRSVCWFCDVTAHIVIIIIIIYFHYTIGFLSVWGFAYCYSNTEIIRSAIQSTNFVYSIIQVYLFINKRRLCFWKFAFVQSKMCYKCLWASYQKRYVSLSLKDNVDPVYTLF